MILAILQARMSSTRLPGKVLKPILDKPIIQYEIDRIKQSKKIDKLVLATSINKDDDVLEKFCKKIGVECFRGDLNNVLNRYYECAKKYNADVIVRLTGDCPVIDPQIIDDVIVLHNEKQNDYTSNTLERTFPDGLDVEVFSFNSLEKAFLKAKDKEDLEHVTKYIYTHKDKFKIGNLKNDIDYSYIRWTLDTIDDFYFFKYFYEKKQDGFFFWKEILSFTKNNKKFIIESNQTIRYAMKKLEEIVSDGVESLYVFNDGKIIGTLSTSDLRRSLIYEDITNNDQVIKIMNKEFHYLEENETYTKDELKKYLRYEFLPKLDKNKKLIIFENIKKLISKPNYVVLMAGGLGSRLDGITTQVPKPMLNIGGKPMLETIINQFKNSYFDNFYISVNHLANQIINHFENGKHFDVNISYLKEKKRMGTAGCLGMIEGDIKEPLFLMNGDILTNVDFEDMLKKHIESKNEITIATVNHKYTVPYGVINIQNGIVKDILEKPEENFSVSAGIYILNPNLIKEIPKDTYYDITSLFDKLLKEKRKIGAYFINDYWLDIGRPDEFYQAHREYNEVFKKEKNDK